SFVGHSVFGKVLSKAALIYYGMSNLNVSEEVSEFQDSSRQDPSGAQAISPWKAKVLPNALSPLRPKRKNVSSAGGTAESNSSSEEMEGSATEGSFKRLKAIDPSLDVEILASNKALSSKKKVLAVEDSLKEKEGGRPAVAAPIREVFEGSSTLSHGS
ncbi:OLC1v1030378C1, partial [Oldenlandia corymbosa var. corymbosa]